MLPEAVTLPVTVSAFLSSALLICNPRAVNLIEPSLTLVVLFLNSIVSPSVIIWLKDPVVAMIWAPAVLQLILLEAVIAPVNIWVSSSELPNIVDPEVTAIILSDTTYVWAVRDPEIITLLPLKDMGSKLPVPSAILTPSFLLHRFFYKFWHILKH